MKVKKPVLWLSVIIVLALCVCLCQGRYYYTPAYREKFSDQVSGMSQSMSYSAPPKDLMEYALCSSDLVIEGEIIEVGEAYLERFTAGINFGIMVTPYTIRVDDVWFGECEEKEVLVIIRGEAETGVAKPHLRDRGVFLLREYGDGYTPSKAEMGIFIKNPPIGRLYAFAPVESAVAFDGKPVQTLREALQTMLDNIALTGGENDNPKVGRVGAVYIEAYRQSQSVS